MSASRLAQLLDGLVDGWCERRALRPLALLLPAYLDQSGLTDATAALFDALTDLRGLPEGELTEAERGAVSEARAVVWQALKAAGVRITRS